MDRYKKCNNNIKYLKYEPIWEIKNIISCLLKCVAMQPDRSLSTFHIQVASDPPDYTASNYIKAIPVTGCGGL
jgi:hypothetical protein